MVNVHIQLHHLVDIERFDCAGGSHAQRVADEAADMTILDYGRKSTECFALFRRFEILLDGCQTFAARTVEQVKQHLEGVQIELAREPGPFENSDKALHDLLDRKSVV